MKLDLLKEHYFFELNRKQYLEGALAFPAAVLTGLGGVVFTMAQSFTYYLNPLTMFFLVFLAGAVASLVVAFVYIVRACHRSTYQLAPASNDLLAHMKKLREYYRAKEYYRSIEHLDAKAEKDFEEGMMEKYAEATTVNKEKNDSKAGYLYRVNLSLISATLFLAFCAGPYFANIKTNPREPQRVEIVNINENRIR